MDDLISRGQAIDAVCAINDEYKSNPHIDAVMDALEELPPAQPEPQEREWIVKKDKHGATYGQCSKCGMVQYAGYTNFCPDCGAKMKGVANA